MKLRLFICLFLGTFLTYAEEKLAPITVYAAASLTNVLPEVAKAWKTENKSREITFSFEATSKLAKQIESGAPADLFFSADDAWMDYLEQKKIIEKDSSTPLLSNQIVLIVPRDSNFKPEKPSELISRKLAHLALAGESVPAGKLARIALAKHAILEALKPKIVNADNVRGALTWVAKKEAEAGIVFKTDAISEAKVQIAFPFNSSDHPQIIYLLGIINKSMNKLAAKSFVDFCKGEKARNLFLKYGFIIYAP